MHGKGARGPLGVPGTSPVCPVIECWKGTPLGRHPGPRRRRCGKQNGSTPTSHMTCQPANLPDEKSPPSSTNNYPPCHMASSSLKGAVTARMLSQSTAVANCCGAGAALPQTVFVERRLSVSLRICTDLSLGRLIDQTRS